MPLPQTTAVRTTRPALYSPRSRVDEMIAWLDAHRAEIERPERGAVTLDFANRAVVPQLQIRFEPIKT